MGVLDRIKRRLDKTSETELSTKITELEGELSTLQREEAQKLGDVRVKSEAVTAWFAKNEQHLVNAYHNLSLAFEKGDADTALKVIENNKPVINALTALSAPEGRDSFGAWASSAFGGDRRVSDALSAITPGVAQSVYADATFTPEEEPKKEKEKEANFFNRLSGGFEAEQLKLIQQLGSDITNYKAGSPGRLQQAEGDFAALQEALLEKTGQLAQGKHEFILGIATNDPGPIGSGLARIKDAAGKSAVMGALTAKLPNGKYPLATLLARGKGQEETTTTLLQAALAPLGDNPTRALALQETAKHTKDKTTRKALKALATATSGAFLRTSEKSLINPAALGVLEKPRDNRLEYLRGSKWDSLILEDGAVTRVMDLAVSTYGHIRVNDRYTINPSKAANIWYDAERKRLNYITGSSHRDMIVEPADAKRILARLAKDKAFFKYKDGAYLNTKQMARVWVNPERPDRVNYITQGDHRELYGMDEQSGKAVLDAVAKQNGQFRYNDNGVLNTAMISKAWTNDQYPDRFNMVISGSHREIYGLTNGEAKTILDEMRKSPRAIEMGDGALVNTAHIAAAWVNTRGEGNAEISLQLPGGSRSFYMSAQQAEKDMAALEALPHIRKVGNELINTGAMLAAWKTGNGMSVLAMGRTNSVTAPAEEIAAIFDELAQKPGYFAAGDEIINTNAAQVLEIQNNSLYYAQGGKYGSLHMKPEEARKLLTRVEDYGRTLGLAKNRIVSPGKIDDVLADKGIDRDSWDNSRDTDDTIFGIPVEWVVIAAIYFTVFSDDGVDAATPDAFDGAGGEFGGAGASGEWSEDGTTETPEADADGLLDADGDGIADDIDDDIDTDGDFDPADDAADDAGLDDDGIDDGIDDDAGLDDGGIDDDFDTDNDFDTDTDTDFDTDDGGFDADDGMDMDDGGFDGGDFDGGDLGGGDMGGFDDLTPLAVLNTAESLRAAIQYGVAIESDALYVQHPATLAYEENLENQLAEKLRITVGQLERNWDDYSTNTKLNILQSIHNRQAETYGFAPLPVVAVMQSPRDGKVMNAHFDPGAGAKGEIGVNVHNAAKINAGAKEAVKMILHEGHHAWMLDLANQLQSGTLDDSKVRNQLAKEASFCVLKSGLEIGIRDESEDTGYARYLNHDMEIRARRAASRTMEKVSALQARAHSPGYAARRKAPAAKP